MAKKITGIIAPITMPFFNEAEKKLIREAITKAGL